MDPVIFLYRVSAFLHRLHVPLLPSLFYLLNRVLFSVVLPPQARIGKNVKFAYLGLGTVVHRNATLGDNVVLGPGVVVGGRSGHSVLPVIEDGAYLGTGAKVLGPVRVGKNSVIGANAVVLFDVPPNCVAVGIPAKVVKTGIAEGAYR